MGTVLGCVGQTSVLAVKPIPDSAAGNPRNKTALKPGHSLMDWVRLGHSGTDLAGTSGRVLDVTPQELAKHNKRNDCWMALKGKVYNITSYMDFHPGGEEELMRGVGTDATDLFNEVHRWVNFETMLQKCLVGRLVESRSFFLKPSFLPLSKNSKISKPDTGQKPPTTKNSLAAPTLELPTVGGAKSPLVSPLTPSSLPSPKYDWFQTNTLINIAIYTKWKHITKEHVVVDKKGGVIKIVCYIQDMVYTVHIDLQKPVGEDFELKTGSNTGKVDVLLNKMETGVRWNVIGKTLEGHGEHVKTKDKKIEYVDCSLESKEIVTQDTRVFVIQVPKSTYLPVPIGYHVYIRFPGNGKFCFAKSFIYMNTSMDNSEVFSFRKVHLILFNKTEEDIPWKEELDNLVDNHSSLLKVTHILSQANDSWSGLKGHIRQDLLEKLLPQRSKERIIYLCICGPLAFTKLGINLFKELGYSSEEFHAFLG
ncbi:cytochrome b5 reductase 4 [Panulirus ornatus]|uniref:cytochrome b5 reductase 4 n=1 Tax=Panulirus ornatus TaxID=150431 RepID=UPI003A88F40A